MLFGKRLSIFRLISVLLLVAVALFFLFKASITGSIV